MPLSGYLFIVDVCSALYIYHYSVEPMVRRY